MKVLIIDNYDSFTFNLYQYVGEILEDAELNFLLDVKRNDAISLTEIEHVGYEKIILSPGPGTPSDLSYFGVCSDVLRKLSAHIPILGICLGMQGIAYVFGGQIKHAAVPMHGKTSLVETDGKGVFVGIPERLNVMRYHSLIVDRDSLPDCLQLTAWTVDQEEQEIMGLRHKQYPFLEGIQFHPESFATEAGKQIIANFLICKHE